MSEKYKSRKSDPVYSSTYDNGGWPARDSLPTKDPIGDVEDEYVEGYKKWKKDMEAYEASMKSHLLNPEGKINIEGLNVKTKLKCNCGTYAVYGKVPVDAHRSYCDLFRAAKNDA